jgi:hypothetical protein
MTEETLDQRTNKQMQNELHAFHADPQRAKPSWIIGGKANSTCALRRIERPVPSMLGPASMIRCSDSRTKPETE